MNLVGTGYPSHGLMQFYSRQSAWPTFMNTPLGNLIIHQHHSSRFVGIAIVHFRVGSIRDEQNEGVASLYESEVHWALHLNGISCTCGYTKPGMLLRISLLRFSFNQCWTILHYSFLNINLVDRIINKYAGYLAMGAGLPWALHSIAMSESLRLA